MESETTEKMKAAQRRMRRAIKRLNELRYCRGALLVALLSAVALEIECAGRDIAEAMRIAGNEAVKTEIEKDGWLWTETGGGCTAYIKNIATGGYFLLTSELSAPTDPTAPVELGLYDADGEYDGVVRQYPNLAAGLEAARQLKGV